MSVTQDPWPDQFFFEEERENFERIQISNFREARMNLTKVKIIFGTLNKVTYRHRAKYEVGQRKRVTFFVLVCATCRKNSQINTKFICKFMSNHKFVANSNALLNCLHSYEQAS